MIHALTIRLSSAGVAVVPNTVWTKEPSATVQVMRSQYLASMSANNRILVSQAGKYLLRASASVTVGVVGGIISLAISKNGAAPTAESIATGSSLTAVVGEQQLYADLFDAAQVGAFYEIWLNAQAATTSLVGARYVFECYSLP